jgi:hypothetical protein
MKDGLAAPPNAEAPPADSGARPARFRLFRRASRPFHLLRSLSLLLFLFFSFVVFVPLPQIILLRWRDPPTTAFIRARQGRLRAQSESDAIDRRPLPEGLTAPAR